MPTGSKLASPRDVESALNAVGVAVLNLQTAQQWTDLLHAAAHHPARPLTDVLLLDARGITEPVASYTDWQEQGRAVRAGQRNVARLLVPHPDGAHGFTLQPVFALSQTDGPAPAEPHRPDLARATVLLWARAVQDGTDIKLRNGLIADSRKLDDRLEVAVDIGNDRWYGVVAPLVAGTLLRDCPPELTDVAARSAAYIAAVRLRLPPPTGLPDPRSWTRHQPPHETVAAVAVAALAAADGLTAELTHRPETLPPLFPMPRKPTEVRHRDEPPAAAVSEEQRELLYAVTDAAAAFYAEHLPGHQAATNYLAGRGILHAADPGSPWRLGVAPGRGDALLNHLTGLGFDVDTMVQAGLVNHSERTGRHYDAFRDRLVFPIHDTQARIIGFTGRTLRTDSTAPKWYNTRETPLYRKSEALYGLGVQLHVDPPDGAERRLVVVEGAADVIAAHHAYQGLTDDGVHTIVTAPCGVAFGEHQFAQLGELVPPGTQLVFGFDSDKAGRTALLRSYPMTSSWPHGDVFGFTLADDKDPAALLHRVGSDEALLTMLATERPLPLAAVDALLDQMIDRRMDLTTPEVHAMAYRAVKPYILDAHKHGHSELLVSHLARRLGVDDLTCMQGLAATFGDDESGPSPPATTPRGVAAAAASVPMTTTSAVTIPRTTPTPTRQSAAARSH